MKEAVFYRLPTANPIKISGKIIRPNGYLITSNEKVKGMSGFHFLGYYDEIISTKEEYVVNHEEIEPSDEEMHEIIQNSDIVDPREEMNVTLALERVNEAVYRPDIESIDGLEVDNSNDVKDELIEILESQEASEIVEDTIDKSKERIKYLKELNPRDFISMKKAEVIDHLETCNIDFSEVKNTRSSLLGHLRSELKKL